jgi:hypothetical protein
MSDSQSIDFVLQVYDELERRGFSIRPDRAEGLDFGKYEGNVGFRKIWLSDFDVSGSESVSGRDFTVRLHPGDTLTQARAYLGYITGSKIDALVTMGWKLENNFHFSTAYGENLWEIVLNAQKDLPCAEYTAFWSNALKQGRVKQYKRADFDPLFQMLEDGKVLDESDRERTETFFDGNNRQVANICPGITLCRSLPRPLLSDDVHAVADLVEHEVTALLKVLDIPKFSLDAYLGRHMNTAAESKSKTSSPLQDYIDLLEYKKQIILQGPPGTGKTYLAKDIAECILTGKVSSDKKEQGTILSTLGQYTLVQFHPSYTYEDFVRGIVVNTSGPTAAYEVTNRVLGQCASEAHENPQKKYVLVIDEINRANLSAVLGELIYALEYRGQAVASMYALKVRDEAGNERDDHQLVLPPNLYIIGTMNTADRSAGHIDYAIRRRFAFVDVLPTSLDVPGFNEELFAQVRALFFKGDGQERSEFLSEEFRPNDVALGHSYFIADPDDVLRMKLRLRYEVKPILLEYVKDGVLKESALTRIRELGK